jgi:DNA-3-methyladenine glycosylase
MSKKILHKEYYLNNDVVELSRNLLGKILCTQFDKQFSCGIIAETEAYRGPEDRASHAYGNRRTKRTEVMFQEGGRCYIYLCYGMHHLFNVVTNVEGVPHAILIRSLLPLEGVELMAERRNKSIEDKLISRGPGTLTKALGITTALNGFSLNSPPIWIEDRGITIPADAIKISARIGIDYAEEDALLPWRFTISQEHVKILSDSFSF